MVTENQANFVMDQPEQLSYWFLLAYLFEYSMNKQQMLEPSSIKEKV